MDLLVGRARGLVTSGSELLQREEVRRARTEVESRVRQRPLLYAGVAFLTGFFLARLLRD